MSKEINITIVTNDEKMYAASERKKEKSMIVTHDSSTTIMSSLLKNRLISGSFCGGRGDCGRCRIQFLKGATMPTALERNVINPEELRQGYRLACLAKPKDNCVIRLALADEPEIAIVSNVIQVPEKNDCISQQKEQTEKHKASVTESSVDNHLHSVFENGRERFITDVTKAVEEGKDKEALIAVDLGTTTIAMHLVGMDDGHIIDTYCEMNPQRRYGSDVLSRIRASCDGEREALQQCVEDALERGVSEFMGQASKQRIAVRGMCIAGNTTMEHLLMGYDVSSLGSSPFIPVEVGLQEYKHSAWDFPVWLVPGISAFVGGDIVAGLYALGMLPNMPTGQGEISKKDPGLTLLVDLGTNGEMVITDGARMVVTATAAGPAFEGGASANLVGSDMIACTDSLLQKGILDETGLLSEPFFTEGVKVGEPALLLCNKDIRDLQMAKAAVRAGIEILWRRMDRRQIGRVYLAGGFGYYLDVEAAFRIGLLPEYLCGKVQAAGNTSLLGAYRIGRDLCEKRIDKPMLEQALSSIESMNLAKQDEFEKLYIQYMDFRRG